MNVKDMNDRDYEGYLIQQGLGGKGLDIDSFDEEQKARLAKYIQGEEAAPSVQSLPGQAQSMQMGLSQAQAPNMSQPQQQSLPGLMGMATQGIQRIPNGMKKGLMGER